MSIRYPCFVSYAHGRGALLNGFRDAIVNELSNELDAFFAEELWVDREMLRAKGQNLEEALAQAICQSVCVIVLFVPKYSSREWCMRELNTALRIEEERLKRLGKKNKPREGLVIPIVLRGEEDDLPDSLRPKVWADFREISTRDPDVTKDAEHAKTIREIAAHIHKVYKAMRQLEAEQAIPWCPDSEKCQLDPATVTTRTLLFPNRERPGL